MTLTIDLTPDQEEHIRRQAARRGLAPAEYLLTLAEEDILLQDFEPIPSDDLRDREETIAGIRRGIEASDAGRVKPLTQVITEARQKHGLPDTWAKP